VAIWSMEIKGLDELARDVAKLPEKAMEDLEGPSIVAGNKVLEAARANVPVSASGKGYYGKTFGKKEWNHPPGFLKENITLKKPGRKRKKKYTVVTTVGFGKNAMYGVPLELGHDLVLFGRRTGKKVKPRPFLRPAADTNKSYVTAVMFSGMDAVLNKFGRKG
jgi:HK97 gp10 family phage protein